MGKASQRKLVVDTDILIDYLRQSKRPTLLKHLISQKKILLYISAVTVAELWRGRSIEKNTERLKVKRLLKKLTIVPVDTKIAQQAGELLRHYPHLVLADALVASTALEKTCELVTLNKRHFTGIDSLLLYEQQNGT